MKGKIVSHWITNQHTDQPNDRSKSDGVAVGFQINRRGEDADVVFQRKRGNASDAIEFPKADYQDYSDR